MRSQEEITQLAANWLLRRYGTGIEVEFHDVSDPRTAARAAGVLREVERRRATLPAVTIDGEYVAIEWFSAWALVDAVEDGLAARAQATGEALAGQPGQ